MNDIIKSKSCCSTTRSTISSRKRTRRNTHCCIGNCHKHTMSISISILFAVLVRVVVILSILACCCNISTNNRTRTTTTLSVFVMGYHHNTCTSDRAKQFQFADCYIPNLADDLLLKDASFVMSHDSGTGYLQRNQQKGVMTTINGAIINLYTKNQLGDVYQQLDDGARALDVRPKLLTNGTIILHHGAVPIGVALETLVSDAIRWSNDNPNELVLILHSNLVYPTISSSSSSSSSGQYNNNDDENDNDYDNDNDNDDYNDAIVPSADTAVTALSQVYDNLGVTYVQCSDLYELTVGEAKELSALSSSSSSSSSGGGGGEKQGYLLAMDRHDAYAGSCAKQNYVENSIVTCYSNQDDILPCTDRKSIQHQRLKEYAMSSANNEPTDNNSILGPPVSTYYYPFNEIQTLWQVDGISAALGVSHVSSIIDDNTKSHVNARIVDWIYDDSNNFNTISLLVVDHVKLNGNALSSVLRNRCGQSELSYDYYNNNNDDNNNYYYYYGIPCGTAVPKPHLRKGNPLSTLSFFVTAFICGVFGIWIAIFVAHYRKHHNHIEEVQRLEGDISDAIYECGCHTTTGGINIVVDDDSNNNNDIIYIGPDGSTTATKTSSKIKSGGNNKEDPLLLPSIN